MRLNEISDWLHGDYRLWVSIAITFCIVLLVLAVNAVFWRLLRGFARRAAAEENHWRVAILKSLDLPLRAMVWIVGLSAAVRILTHGSGLTLLVELFSPARDVAVIAVIIWFVLRSITHVEEAIRVNAASKGQVVDATAADAIGKLVRAAVLITGVLVGLQTLGFSISGVLAFGGIGGIAIGFAAQGLVANLFGGLTIYASRLFAVGEWIVMPGTEVMGEVQQIGWRSTRVMGFDRRPFYVPNSLFNTAVLINHTRMTARRIMEHIHLRYRDIDKVEAIVADTNRMLSEHPGIEHDFFLFRLDTCGEFALKLYLYAFTNGTDYSEYMRTKEEILLRIAAIIRQHGAEISVPTSTVHLPDPLRLGDGAAEPMIAGLVRPDNLPPRGD